MAYTYNGICICTGVYIRDSAWWGWIRPPPSLSTLMVGCINFTEHLVWHTRIMGFVVVRVYNLKIYIWNGAGWGECVLLT